MFAHWRYSFLLLAYTSTATCADGPPIANYLPPDTNAIVAVNVRKLANDPMTSALLNLRGMAGIKAKLNQVQMASGIDLRADIERVCFARNMNASEDDSVLAIEGHMDAGRIRGVLALADEELETTTVGNIKDVLTWNQGIDENVYLAFLPNNVQLVTFRREAMEKALAQPNAATTIAQRLQPHLSRITPDVDSMIAWGHVTNPAGSKMDDDNPAMHVQEIAAAIDSTPDGLNATVRATIDSPERTKDLLEMARGIVALGKLKFDGMADEVSLTTDDTSNTIIAKANFSRTGLMKVAEMIHTADKARNDYARDAFTTEAQKVRQQAQLARQQATLQRQRAELARQRAKIERERARVERQIQALERSINSSDPFATGSSHLAIPPIPPVPPVPAVPPVPPVSPVPTDAEANPFARGIKLPGALNLIDDAPVSPGEIEKTVNAAVQSAVESALLGLQSNDRSPN